MPLIKPFKALIPAAHLQRDVVTWPLENYSTGEAKLIASENSFSFLHLINPALEHPYLRGSRQDLIYKKIQENLEDFLHLDVLVQVSQPAYYIYQISCNGLVQHGIWALSEVSSYLDGSIKKHELTVERREKQLSDYMQQTGLDANPVLITYRPDQVIDGLMKEYMETQPVLDFVLKDKSLHRVWIVDEEADIDLITSAFRNMDAVYIADGHHRAAAMAKMDCFSTVYMSTEEVRILQYNRLVKDLNGLGKAEFLELLEEDFEVEKSPGRVEPDALHVIGMYLENEWYYVRPRAGLFDEQDAVASLDVSILQEHILEPLLKIKDPRTDTRISFEGAAVAVEKLQEMVDNGLYVIAFTLHAVTVDQLMKVADEHKVMPPKSTWIEPKFLVGLLTNRIT